MGRKRFGLDEKERRAFKQAEAQARNAKELKRLQAVRWYGEGQPVEQIQEMLSCSWRSLMEWGQRYRAGGLSGLTDRRQGGNRAKLTWEQRQAIRGKVQQYQPDQVLAAETRISRGVFWTVSDLSLAVKLWYGVTYQSPTSYLNLLHECGFSQQKVEKQYRSRPSEADIADFEAQVEKK
jgi:transposase